MKNMETLPGSVPVDNVKERHDRIEREIEIHNLLLDRKSIKDGVFENLEEGDTIRLAGIPNNLIVEDINQRRFSERLRAAIAVGVLTEVDGLSWSYFSNRPIVFAKIGGINIPFYRSASGASSKNKGEWYPFFGIGDDYWFIKSTDVTLGDKKNPAIEKVQKILNKTFTWDSSLDTSQNNGLAKHPFGSGSTQNQYMSYKELNDRVFHADLGGISQMGEAEHIYGYIHPILTQIMKNVPREVLEEVMATNKQKVSELGFV
jgi:hypothetical protein